MRNKGRERENADTDWQIEDEKGRTGHFRMTDNLMTFLSLSFSVNCSCASARPYLVI